MLHYLESDADAPYERVFSGNEFDRMPADNSERFGMFCLRGRGAGVNKRACVKASVFVGRQERGNMPRDLYCETLHRYLREFGAFMAESGGFSVAWPRRALWFARLCSIMALGG